MASPSLPGQISLSVSARSGIVAIPGGEKYPWAETALRLAGFTRGDGGVYTLANTDPAATRHTLAQLVVIAGRHRTSITTSSRPYIGDAADAIVRGLPGAWTATLEIYSHPVWQEDLVPWLWDAGPLATAVRTERVPCAAQLGNGEGVHLMLVERPGHTEGYLLGALAPVPFDDNDECPFAPRSIVLPQTADAAAQAITEEFLPAYHQAIHYRRIDAAEQALARARAIVQRQRACSSAPARGSRQPRPLDGSVAEDLWYDFREFMVHAPFLFAQCPPERRPSRDRAALDRLRAALETGAGLLPDWQPAHKDPQEAAVLIRAEKDPEARAHRGRQAWPAIQTWLADGDTLTRHARDAAPRTRSPALAQGTPAALPAPAAGTGAGPHR
ncbi:hypothetical protein [Streptomyces sp. NPDC014894]|uniref:hypothetical protein n=1 Tax=Streptomyces sp. NPDC014894 TaxID=3364931 RepID=UPI0036FB2AFE